jgi:large subunit ribosomal protein L24
MSQLKMKHKLVSAAKLKLKKGDNVVVITGKDKGKTGAILRVLPKESRVVVAGVARVKRHTKPSQMNAGGIIEKEMPIHISNVALADPKDGKASRVGYKTLNDGTKVRVAKRSGEQVGDNR